MKKSIIFLFIILIFSLCGCEHAEEIETNRVITACIITSDTQKINYGFFVSVPQGSEGGEEGGSKSSGKLYEFSAANFNDAIKQFEQNGQQKIDIAHMSLLAADINYFKEHFLNDEKYIRKTISATPLINTCIIDCDKQSFVECINNEYLSKAEDFSSNVLKNKSIPYNSTISELSLAANNKFYTSTIPVIKLNSHGEYFLPEIKGVVIYSQINGPFYLTDEEFKIYTKWMKKHKDISKSYKINIDKNNLVTHIPDKEIVDLARKYALMNIDILNVKYHAKKCFLTYNDYKKYFNDYNLISAVFTEDDK